MLARSGSQAVSQPRTGNPHGARSVARDKELCGALQGAVCLAEAPLVPLTRARGASARACCRAVVVALLACLLVAPSIAAQDAAQAGHSLVLIRSESGTFSVIGTRELPGPLPRAVPPTGHQGWSFQALDRAGAVIHTGALPNPHVIRGEFADPRTGALSRAQLSSGEGKTFALRVPRQTDVLVLYGVPLPMTALATRTASAASTTRTTDTARSGSSVLARIRLGGAP